MRTTSEPCPLCHKAHDPCHCSKQLDGIIPCSKCWKVYLESVQTPMHQPQMKHDKYETDAYSPQSKP